LTIDEDRVTPGAAKGGIFGSDLYPFLGLESMENLEGFGFNDLQIERARIGIDGEFFYELPSYPGNMSKLACLSEPFDNFPADSNGSILSFSESF